MARYCKQRFDPENEKLALFANSISHPARLEIIKIISDKKECTCGEIVNLLPFSQSTVSQHLSELKISGILESRSEGTKSLYSLNQDSVDEFVFYYNTFFKKLMGL